MLLTLSPADVRHREDFKAFVLSHSHQYYRPLLQLLYSRWETYLKEYFQIEMVPPYLLIASPSRAQALGDYSPVSSFGGHSQIRIRPTLFSGEHKMLREEDEYEEGRTRFICDVLLHEMIHQYQFEVSGVTEESYKGHGPHFAGKCNEIGAKLELPKVRAAKARGKDKELPSCAHWPHCVRPADYYLGALVNGQEEDGEDAGSENDGDGETAIDDRERALLSLIEAARAFQKLWPEGTENEALEGVPSAEVAGLAGLIRAVREF